MYLCWFAVHSPFLHVQVLSFSLDDQDMAHIHAYLTSHSDLGNLPHRDCGDEYRVAPYLTASGDLSHHLSANLPSIYSVQQVDLHLV
jgi:hypothetical protein